MKYRREIDGLRGLAVIAVIANHFNNEFLPGGYLGVDIFFVISGFVISASLYDRKEEKLGQFLTSFYARRIKRLLPALAVFVVILSLFTSLVNPSPAASIKTGLAAILGLSNIYLIYQSTDYFGDSALLNSFTHTWSLGVEEQFYLFFPFLVWFAAFGLRAEGMSKRFYLILSLLSLISFGLFCWLSARAPYIAYYSMPARFWELAAGSFAFLVATRGMSLTPFLADLFSGFCLLLLCVTLALPGSYPALSAFSAVFVTALLLCSIQSGTLSFRVLTLNSIVYVGLISYSLYLWHWGVLVVSRWSIGIHWWSIPIQIILMFFFAYLSYKYVESPLRKAHWSSKSQLVIFQGFTIMLAACLVLVTLWKPMRGWFYLGRQPPLIASGVGSLTDSYSVPGYTSGWQGSVCVLSSNDDVGKLISKENCTLGDFETARTRVLVIGNSFSASFVSSFDALVREDGFAVTVTSSWGASPVKQIPNYSAWSKANEYYWSVTVPQLISELRRGDWVFIMSDLSSFSPSKSSLDTNARLQQFEQGLEVFSNALSENELRLAVLHGNPFVREANCEPAAAVRQWFSPFGSPCRFISKKKTLERRAHLDRVLKALEERDKIVVVDLMDVFCPHEVCDYHGADSSFLYRDVWSHPSVEAARMSAPIIRRALGTS